MVSVFLGIVLSLVAGFVAVVVSQGGDVDQAEARLADAWQKAEQSAAHLMAGAVRAQAATLLTQAEQIASANTLYAGEHGGVYAHTVAELVAGSYLQSIPVLAGIPGEYRLGADNAEVRYAPLTPELCQAVTDLASQSGAANAPFACVTGTAGELVFLRKG